MKDNQSTMENLKNYLAEKGHENIQIEFIEASIEDCFMELLSNVNN
jgi:uncharacterized protein (UPF0276 family)